MTASARLSAGAIILFALCVQAAPPESRPTPQASHTPARRITVIGVSNFGIVSSRLYRGGQPTGTGYKHLKELGVDIVVDLRLSGRDTEKQNVTQAGMQFVALPWHCMFPKDRVFAEFLKLVRDNRGKKIFVHCRYGDDRTGMMIAAYRMAVEGWTPEEAAKEMKKFGFHRMLCPSLGPYEKSFPERLKKDPEFQDLRRNQAEMTR